MSLCAKATSTPHDNSSPTVPMSTPRYLLLGRIACTECEDAVCCGAGPYAGNEMGGAFCKKMWKMGSVFCKKVENTGCYFVKKVENGGVFFVKKWKIIGGCFCKKWTFSQRRVHYVQYQYFLFYVLLIWGCVRTPAAYGPVVYCQSVCLCVCWSQL